MISEKEILSVKQRFGIIGNSQLLNVAIEKAIMVANTDMTVLITGESGSGKESFSKIIHNIGKRKHKGIITINCGALPEGTIDSELFGHEKGSFTGAIEKRKGYFETVNGGTIFLDEIGEMPPQTQSRLLRILEYGEFIRIGSSKVHKTDVRVVAATNRDLYEQSQKGEFREDLYYRLNTVPIKIPPLRERGRDIHLLFRKFVNELSEQYKIPLIKLDEQAQELLLSYSFPGNIRQLKNITYQICIFEKEQLISADRFKQYLPETMQKLPGLRPSKSNMDSSTERDILYKILFDLKREVGDLKTLVKHILDADNDDDKLTNLKVKNPKLLELALGTERSPSTFSDYSSAPMEAKSKISENKREIEKEDQLKKDNTILLIEKNQKVKRNNPYQNFDEINIEDIDLEKENQSLSLIKNEKQLIIKALKKNEYKRKYAAKDLGISERTLYRKIKQYDLE